MEFGGVVELLDVRPFASFDVDMKNGRSFHGSQPENVTVFPDRPRG